MKWSTVTVGVMILGIIGVSIILLFQQLTTTNENDYYLLKEITEAAMVDSIDISYYRETGELKIVREKFVENFTRRFAESTLIIGTKYTIKFFDIMEEPPKVSVRIDTGIENYKIYNTSGNYEVLNQLTGIFEYVGKRDNGKTISGEENPYEKKKKELSAMLERNFVQRRIFKAFPNLKNGRYKAIFDRISELKLKVTEKGNEKDGV